MGEKPYVGDIGTEILLDCGSDITAATDKKILVKKPDGTTHEWTDVAIQGGTKLQYFTVSGDFDQDGVYYFQAYVLLPTWQGKGETVELEVFRGYN